MTVKKISISTRKQSLVRWLAPPEKLFVNDAETWMTLSKSHTKCSVKRNVTFISQKYSYHAISCYVWQCNEGNIFDRDWSTADRSASSSFTHLQQHRHLNSRRYRTHEQIPMTATRALFCRGYARLYSNEFRMWYGEHWHCLANSLLTSSESMRNKCIGKTKLCHQ